MWNGGNELACLGGEEGIDFVLCCLQFRIQDRVRATLLTYLIPLFLILYAACSGVVRASKVHNPPQGTVLMFCLWLEVPAVVRLVAQVLAKRLSLCTKQHQ